MTKRSIIGIDVGGTKIAARRYDADTWDMEAEERIGTPHGKSFRGVIRHIEELAERLRTRETSALGIGLPGLIDRNTGRIVTLPNIEGADGHDIASDLTSLDLPLSIENDSNCFALAEALHGAGKGHSVILGITMGTGVGGGIVIDGNIFSGAHGFAGEIGHMLLRPGTPPEGSADTRGEVEQFLSGIALRRRCVGAHDPKDLLAGDVCDFLHADIHREVAWLCANAIHMVDPGIIVFGGGTGRALRDHLPRIRAELTRWVLPGTPLPALAIGSLVDAGTLGAALCTLPLLQQRTFGMQN